MQCKSWPQLSKQVVVPANNCTLRMRRFKERLLGSCVFRLLSCSHFLLVLSAALWAEMRCCCCAGVSPAPGNLKPKSSSACSMLGPGLPSESAGIGETLPLLGRRHSKIEEPWTVRLKTGGSLTRPVNYEIREAVGICGRKTKGKEPRMFDGPSYLISDPQYLSR
jgi:hypothetical protein